LQMLCAANNTRRQTADATIFHLHLKSSFSERMLQEASCANRQRSSESRRSTCKHLIAAQFNLLGCQCCTYSTRMIST
jgi:hypothetical protein